MRLQEAPFLVNELGGLQDPQWTVLRQAMHEAVSNLTKAAVIANSDMGDDSGRVRAGLPSGAMHSRRKVNLGRRNGLAMIKLMEGDVEKLAPHTGASGPVLQSATISKDQEEYTVTITFKEETAQMLHFAGAADCTICCASRNGSAIALRVENASDPTVSTTHTKQPTLLH
eukprot:COSAG06_NODE_4787_length_3954_cov_12.519585_5_plen_171_part_00